MKICDKCAKPTAPTQEFGFLFEDQYFDLCDKHAQEIMKWLTQKEKPKKRLFKNSAKAA